jgi:hypothetical protein
MGDWYCPTCESFHSVPWVDPFEWVEPGAAPEEQDDLAADQLGHIIEIPE